MKTNQKLLLLGSFVVALGWLQAGPHGGAYCTTGTCAPAVYTTAPWIVPVVVVTTPVTSGGFSNINTAYMAAPVEPAVVRVPPPVFDLPSVASTEAFHWKH